MNRICQGKTTPQSTPTLSLLAFTAAITLAVEIVPGVAYAQNSRNELPIPASPEQDLTAIQRTFRPPPPPPLTLFPELRDRLQELPPFLRDSKVSLDPRSYYRDVVTNAPDKVTV